ncbi:hypothetical protein QAD02_002926 [Eretmocerus hayati]|uniref:Uncharacterized protein n=1 Tax=Eretmocerus hayati TaxID=131215 RepID=A0ACC2NN61_9HYME|nr:hypothetical protein QAD02_002926 [Eretmocerus hayati]
MDTIRNYQCVYYSCIGRELCKRCFNTLGDHQKVFYSVEISRTAGKLVDLGLTHVCDTWGRQIPYYRREIIQAYNSETGTALLDLLDSPATADASIPIGVNINSTAQLNRHIIASSGLNVAELNQVRIRLLRAKREAQEIFEEIFIGSENQDQDVASS